VEDVGSSPLKELLQSRQVSFRHRGEQAETKCLRAGRTDAVELAALPEAIRGYGHIRRRHAEHASEREAELMAQLRGGDATQRVQDTSVARSRERVLMAG